MKSFHFFIFTKLVKMSDRGGKVDQDNQHNNKISHPPHPPPPPQILQTLGQPW